VDEFYLTVVPNDPTARPADKGAAMGFVGIYGPASGTERQRIIGPFPTRDAAGRYVSEGRIPELYVRAWVLPMGEPHGGRDHGQG
jgi:hypothetical protein